MIIYNSNGMNNVLQDTRRADWTDNPAAYENEQETDENGHDYSMQNTPGELDNLDDEVRGEGDDDSGEYDAE